MLNPGHGDKGTEPHDHASATLLGRKGKKPVRLPPPSGANKHLRPRAHMKRCTQAVPDESNCFFRFTCRPGPVRHRRSIDWTGKSQLPHASETLQSLRI